MSLREIISNLEVKDLTIDELKDINFSDRSLYCVHVEFKNEDNHYKAIHVSKRSDEPYILLCGMDKNVKDFKKVSKGIKKITKGRFDYDFMDRGIDICQVLHLRSKLTQKRIADFVEKYSTKFEDVRIPIAYFKDIPKDVYTLSRIPREKIDFCD